MKVKKIQKYIIRRHGVSFVFNGRIEISYDPDFERDMGIPIIEVTAEFKGKKYKFVVKNIPDFGRVINPNGGATASGLIGGLPMNTREFMERNKTYLAYSKERELTRKEQEEIFMKEHPTKTGFGWDRSFFKDKKWVPMTHDEVHVYKTLLKVLPDYMHDIRM